MNRQNSIILGVEILVCLIAFGLYTTGSTQASQYLLTALILVGISPLVFRMVKDVIKGNYGIDILAMVAISSALALGEILAATVILLMLTGGEALEEYAQSRARDELKDLLARAPQTAHKYEGDKITDVPVDQVNPGDKLLIKPGETVPVDSVITEGASSFDESSITGESLPVEKKVGDDLVSGSINSDSSVKVSALRSSGNSQYEQIIELVRVAASTESPLVRLADRYSIPFTIISFVIAGGAWIYSGSALRGLEVLVVATPCPLLIATPVAIVAGMSRSAKRGIIVKTAGALEQLARIRAVAFDKTGTLTQGQPTISKILINKIEQPKVVAFAAALSGQSNHILSSAIVNYAKTQNITVPTVTELKEKTGSGVSAIVEGKKIMLGKLSWLNEEGVAEITPQTRAETVTHLAVDGVYAGALYFTDPVRPETKPMLASLKQLGVEHTIMLTGDHQEVADTIAESIGGIEVQANLKPADKVEFVKELQGKYSPVAMVGDGVNDAPTLVVADVGIALGARGSTAASESANIVIMPDDIGHVTTAIKIAKQTITIAKQSIFVGIGLSILLMLVATSGFIKPVYGALLQEGVDVLVIINALRARKI